MKNSISAPNFYQLDNILESSDPIIQTIEFYDDQPDNLQLKNGVSEAELVRVLIDRLEKMLPMNTPNKARLEQALSHLEDSLVLLENQENVMKNKPLEYICDKTSRACGISYNSILEASKHFGESLLSRLIKPKNKLVMDKEDRYSKAINSILYNSPTAYYHDKPLNKLSFWEYCYKTFPEFYTKEKNYLRRLCEGLQEFYEDPKQKILIVNMPPRTGKSRIHKDFYDWINNEINIFNPERYLNGYPQLNNRNRNGKGYDLLIWDGIYKDRADFDQNSEIIKSFYYNKALSRLTPNAKQIIISSRFGEFDLPGEIIKNNPNAVVINIPIYELIGQCTTSDIVHNIKNSLDQEVFYAQFLQMVNESTDVYNNGKKIGVIVKYPYHNQPTLILKDGFEYSDICRMNLYSKDGKLVWKKAF